MSRLTMIMPRRHSRASIAAARRRLLLHSDGAAQWLMGLGDVVGDWSSAARASLAQSSLAPAYRPAGPCPAPSCLGLGDEFSNQSLRRQSCREAGLRARNPRRLWPAPSHAPTGRGVATSRLVDQITGKVFGATARAKPAAWRASSVISAQSPAAIAALGATQVPPTHRTLARAR